MAWASFRSTWRSGRSHVHVVEIDERLREALSDATDPHLNVTVHWADAVTLDLGALDPSPTKVVANLPYGVAASVLLRTIEELPGVSVWVAMVQREVGERLAADRLSARADGSYGAPSVLAQLVCDVAVLRAIPRTVFHPVPNVDSVLVGMRRRESAHVGGGRRRRRWEQGCARWWQAGSPTAARRLRGRWRCRGRAAALARAGARGAGGARSAGGRTRGASGAGGIQGACTHIAAMRRER